MTTPADWEDELAEPDELDPANPLLSEDDPASGEDYHPATARPDLEGAAAEADVVEQAYELVEDDADAEPES